MKQYKNIRQNVYAIVIVSGASLLRCFLAWNNWPLLNSDEGTMGIMAIHILHGAHPIFFYGQNYMGAGEAYIGALLFELFGISVFTLRLGLIFLFALFLVCMYMLTSKLYTRTLALFTLLILSLGSNAVLSRQLMALGGYVETLLLIALAFLFTYQLAHSQASKHMTKRALVYGCWGFVIGLGLWSDLIIIPWAIGASMLLLLFCWRELLKGAILPLLLGLMLGALPLIIYNVSATPNQTSWATLMSQQGSVPLTFNLVLQQIKNTMEVSIPTITGDPFCHFDELSGLKILGFEQSYPPTLQCHVAGFAWSTTYLFLLAISAGLALFSLRKVIYTSQPSKDTSKIVKYSFQIVLVFCTILSLGLYVHSHAPLDGKAEYARYLIGLWVVTPLALWPLWRGITHTRYLLHRKLSVRKIKTVAYLSSLLVLISIFLYGTVKTLTEVPLARAADVQESQFIHELLEHHIVHVYTDYWTCDRLAFQDQEHIICGVLTNGCSLQRDSHNRYGSYYTIVSNDSEASYLIHTDLNCDQAIKLKMTRQGKRYQTFTLNEYTVYQPI